MFRYVVSYFHCMYSINSFHTLCIKNSETDFVFASYIYIYAIGVHAILQRRFYYMDERRKTKTLAFL